MEISFSKYHGTGNDFIMIDDRDTVFPDNNHKLINQLCHRRFGIGADGLILIQKDEESDFSMKYFNSDGFEGSMCGNGGRCTVHFARELGIIAGYTRFMAADGLHHASIEEDTVKLGMSDINHIEKIKNFHFIDSGSPHIIIPVNNINEIDVVAEGSRIRYNTELFPDGTNVNYFQELEEGYIKIRTYERGVEDETWSCGTGAVASAIFYSKSKGHEFNKIKLEAPGGQLEVSFIFENNIYTEVSLKGLATLVYNGIVHI